jgi:hypothetical protein
MGSRVELLEQICRDHDREAPLDPGAGRASWGASPDGASGVQVAVAAGQEAAGGPAGAWRSVRIGR